MAGQTLSPSAGARSANADPSGVAGRDMRLLMVVPGVLVIVGLFIYPFIYGFISSFNPQGDNAGWLDNYQRFFSQPRLYETVGKTLWLALPVTILNVGLAVPFAFMLRTPSRGQRLLSTLLVIPMTLGTVLVAEGLMLYLAPNGWLNRTLLELGILGSPLRLLNNYWGVALSLLITGFPFAFMMMLSYTTGIDPTLARAAATLGASPIEQFRRIYLPLLVPGLTITFCLTFVQAFAVFPSAVLLGAPAGATRVISIAAYEMAYEEYNWSMASTVAMVMGATQLIIVGIVLGLRQFSYRGPVVGGKG
ncbi:ABC transporter permease [Devosia sp.]|uniref:ABC transporter permease n=1 Tax=Devosia sp. TaxID=1871048 RepID=UPI003A5991D3